VAAGADFGFQADPPTHSLYGFADNGQTNASPFVFIASVDAL
jgi:hypothetical protein